MWEGAHDKGLLLSTEHECDRTRSMCFTLAPCRESETIMRQINKAAYKLICNDK